MQKNKNWVMGICVGCREQRDCFARPCSIICTVIGLLFQPDPVSRLTPSSPSCRLQQFSRHPLAGLYRGKMGGWGRWVPPPPLRTRGEVLVLATPSYIFTNSLEKQSNITKKIAAKTTNSSVCNSHCSQLTCVLGVCGCFIFRHSVPCNLIFF